MELDNIQKALGKLENTKLKDEYNDFWNHLKKKYNIKTNDQVKNWTNALAPYFHSQSEDGVFYYLRESIKNAEKGENIAEARKYLTKVQGKLRKHIVTHVKFTVDNPFNKKPDVYNENGHKFSSHFKHSNKEIKKIIKCIDEYIDERHIPRSA